MHYPTNEPCLHPLCKFMAHSDGNMRTPFCCWFCACCFDNAQAPQHGPRCEACPASAKDTAGRTMQTILPLFPQPSLPSWLDIQSFSVNASEPGFALRAAGILRNSGFVVVNGALTSAAALAAHQMCLRLEEEVRTIDPWRLGNRGPGRYCLHNVQSHQNCWNYDPIFAQAFADNGYIMSVLDELLGNSSDDWQYCNAGGDYILGGVPSWQYIHSDFGNIAADDFDIFAERTKPPVLMASYITHPHDCRNGPLMIVPWAEIDKYGKRPPPELNALPSPWLHWARCRLFPLEAGACVLRDVRVWHAGTPNVSDAARFMPGVLAVRTDCMKPQGSYDWPMPCLPLSLYQSLSMVAQARLRNLCVEDIEKSEVVFNPFHQIAENLPATEMECQ